MKNKPKLLLIETGEGREEKGDVIPLNLAYIASFAEANGFAAEILDLNLKTERRKLEKSVEKADLIAISCYTHNYNLALKILKKIKKSEEEKPVAIGGVHATPLYKEALEDGFDLAVRCEGELPTSALLSALEKGNLESKLSKIPGIAFKENGKIKVNPVWRAENLDELPFPARRLLKLSKYAFPGAIATTRGCAYLCTFCSARNQSGMLRMRSVKSLVDELEEIKALGINSFFVVDPNVAFDKKRVTEFCTEVKKLKMQWYSELRLDQVDREIIKMLSTSNCKVVRFGIESGSQDMVDEIKKGISLKELMNKLKLLIGNGITPVCGFMLGMPNETRKDFEKTLKLAGKITKLGGVANFSVLTPYPGSYIYKNAEKLGIKIVSKDWEDYHYLNPVIETKNFKREELRSMLFEAMLKVNTIKVPEIELKNEKPEIVKLIDSLKRKSFRNTAQEFEAC